MNKYPFFKNIGRAGLIIVLIIGCATKETMPDLEADNDFHYMTPAPDESRKSSLPTETPSGTKLSIQQIVTLALHHNPEVSAAQSRWRAATEKYPQVTSLPDPMLTYTYFLNNVETRVGPQKQSISIMQNIPFPRKLYLKGEIAKDEADISRYAYERTIRDIATRIQKSFYELGYIQGAIAITQKNEDLLGHLVQLSASQYAKDSALATDVMKGQSQLAQLAYDRVRLEELKRVEEGQINALLNRNPQTGVQLEDFVFSTPQDLQDFMILYQHALHNNQEILAAEIAIEKANHKLSLAFSEYFPDFSVGFTWVEVDRTLSGFNFDFDDDGQDITAMTFGMNLPIWVPRRNAQVRESKLNIQEAKDLKQNIENQLAADLKKLYYKVSNSLRLIKLYQNQLLPEAEKSMRLAENWYRDGKGSLMGLLETQSVWQNFSLALLRAQADYAQGIVELARLCGGALPQRQVGEESK